LEKQIVEANQVDFSLPAGLTEFTRLTNEKLWATNFNWDAGELRVELKADVDEPDLTLSLQESPLLTDFTMRKRQLPDQSANYSISCRMKTEVERAAFVPPPPAEKSIEETPPVPEKTTPDTTEKPQIENRAPTEEMPLPSPPATTDNESDQTPAPDANAPHDSNNEELHPENLNEP
jgi:outer membrane biosynthesis protein TonB